MISRDYKWPERRLNTQINLNPGGRGERLRNNNEYLVAVEHFLRELNAELRLMGLLKRLRRVCCLLEPCVKIRELGGAVDLTVTKNLKKICGL